MSFCVVAGSTSPPNLLLYRNINHHVLSTMVRVDEETHEKLKNLRRDGESLDSVISRPLERRERDVEEGAGFWIEDESEGARRARRSMKRDVGVD